MTVSYLCMHVGRANPPVPPARRQQNHSAHTTSTSVAPSATFSPPGSITRSDSPPLPPYNVVTGSNKPPQHLDDDEFEVRVMCIHTCMIARR